MNDVIKTAAYYNPEWIIVGTNDAKIAEALDRDLGGDMIIDTMVDEAEVILEGCRFVGVIDKEWWALRGVLYTK